VAPAEAFERDYGCTEDDWLRWLPGAVGAHTLDWLAPRHAQVHIGSGQLALRWSVLPPRRIALITMPRMAVGFTFEAVPPHEQAAFMRYFDLYMQRGGG